MVMDPPDGRIPALTAAAQKRMAEARAETRKRPDSGPEGRILMERCIVLPVGGPVIEFYTMTQIEGPYFPLHDQCGKKQAKLTADQRNEILRFGHVSLHCEDCQVPWVFTPPAEDMAKLRRLSG